MAPIYRACPRCEYRPESDSLRCSECGVEMPRDLRMLAGATERGHLSRRSLIVRSILRAAFGLFVVLFATPWMIYAVVLLLRPAGPRRGSTSMLTFVLAVFALTTVAGLWLLSRLPSRIRAIKSKSLTPEDLRWTWTGSRFWRDASTYPGGDEPWENFSSVVVSRKADSLRITLYTDGHPGVPLAQLWIRGTDDEGEAIQVELSRHLGSSRS